MCKISVRAQRFLSCSCLPTSACHNPNDTQLTTRTPNRTKTTAFPSLFLFAFSKILLLTISNKVGTLPNGLRYVLLKNAAPAGRFEAHLEILAGSADEDDSQQGMAHLVEHIAYMGSRKREALFGTGSQTNAYTDFHHTVSKQASKQPMVRQSQPVLEPFVAITQRSKPTTDALSIQSLSSSNSFLTSSAVQVYYASCPVELPLGQQQQQQQLLLQAAMAAKKNGGDMGASMQQLLQQSQQNTQPDRTTMLNRVSARK